jgi:hypothetical protein
MLDEYQIEQKYKIVYVNKQRYYTESLVTKDYDLENTTPYTLDIGKSCFITSSWKQLLIEVSTFLLKDNPSIKNDLLAYKPDWSSSHPYSPFIKKNTDMVGEGIFIHCTYTARQSCWVLRDVLIIGGYDLSKCQFVIHRTPSAEPKECREFYEKKTKDGFKYYYVQLYKYSEERADKVIRNIEKLNRFLQNVSPAYDNFFLINDVYTFSNLKSKLIKYMEPKVEPKTLDLVRAYLKELGDYYKAIK